MVKLSSAEPCKLICLPITELHIDRVTLLVVTYPVNNNALMFLFIARQALNLSSSIVLIGHHFTVRISHRLHPVPTVVGGTIDISSDICHTRHHHTDSLCYLTLRKGARDRVFLSAVHSRKYKMCSPS